MRTSALLDMFSYKFFTPYLQIRLAIDISNFSKLYHRIPHLGSCFDNIKRDLNSGFEPILQCLLTSEIPHKNNNNIAVIGPKFIPKKTCCKFFIACTGSSKVYRCNKTPTAAFQKSSNYRKTQSNKYWLRSFRISPADIYAKQSAATMVLDVDKDSIQH